MRECTRCGKFDCVCSKKRKKAIKKSIAELLQDRDRALHPYEVRDIGRDTLIFCGEWSKAKELATELLVKGYGVTINRKGE